MSVARGSSSATALRRLMTEYKQLTSGGQFTPLMEWTTFRRISLIYILLSLLNIHSGSPDGMFTAGTYSSGCLSYPDLMASFPVFAAFPCDLSL